MELRAVRRHAWFALALLILLVMIVRLVRASPELETRDFEGIVFMVSLGLAMFGHSYASRAWRRICEGVAVCLLAGAIALRIFA